jgi:DNA modification methylase
MGGGDVSWRIYNDDCLETLRQLPSESVNCCVTSPPYWGLRDYGVAGQLGLEATPEEYVTEMVQVFREVRRVLRDDGTLWLNLGDSYASKMNGRENGIGSRDDCTRSCRVATAVPDRRDFSGLKPKDLVGIPWRVAFALQADGWWLRSDIVWFKGNPMPESVTDRPTKAHEYVFLLAKSERYYYDQDAIREPLAASSIARLGQNVEGQAGSERANGGRKTNGPMKAVCFGGGKTRDGHTYSGNPWESDGKGANKRTVWEIPTTPYPEAHFAVYPEKLVEPCILAGCPEGGTVLDPFAGSGTTLAVAQRLGRNSIGIELNPDYTTLAEKRLAKIPPSLFEVAATKEATP